MGNPKQKREQQVERYAHWPYAQHRHFSVECEKVPSRAASSTNTTKQLLLPSSKGDMLVLSKQTSQVKTEMKHQPAAPLSRTSVMSDNG